MQDTLETFKQEKKDVHSHKEDAVHDEVLKHSIFDGGRCFSNLSHELRTPLTVILAEAELLEQEISGNLNSEQLEHVREILSHGVRLRMVIEQLLDWSKIQEIKNNARFVAFDFLPLLQKTIQLVEPSSEMSRLQLSEPGNQKFFCYGNQVLLRKAIQALLGNALKFSAPDQKVQLSLKSIDWTGSVQNQKALRLQIKDEGMGIEKSEFRKIFQPFYQVDCTASRFHGGMGLGLALAKYFAEMHQGAIRIQSELGVGSVFELLLPLHN